MCRNKRGGADHATTSMRGCGSIFIPGYFGISRRFVGLATVGPGHRKIKITEWFCLDDRLVSPMED